MGPLPRAISAILLDSGCIMQICVLSARVRDGSGMSCQGGGRYGFTYLFFDGSGVAWAAVKAVASPTVRGISFATGDLDGSRPFGCDSRCEPGFKNSGSGFSPTAPSLLATPASGTYILKADITDTSNAPTPGNSLSDSAIHSWQLAPVC